MDKLIINKSKWFLFRPCFWGVILAPFLIGFLFIGYALLRYKLDKIEIVNDTLYSRFGVFNVDIKTIPLNKISMVSIKKDLIGSMLGYSTIEVQSSALDSSISYSFIKEAESVVNEINAMITNNQKWSKEA